MGWWRRNTLTAIGVGAYVFVTVPHAQSQMTTIMSGLDHPRGLAFGPEGALYVAEAGRGGEGPCGVNAPGEVRCYGSTGAITRLWHGVQEQVVSGLPSHALPSGAAAVGPNDISFNGRGGAYVTLGLSHDPAILRPAMGAAGPLFGTMIHVAASGVWRVVAELATYETDANPAGGPIDSNPYGLLAEPAARLVADAAMNALLRVAPSDEISTLAVFPSRPARVTDAVPTSVVVGPDGAYYVGELAGAPFAAGAARVYRVVPGAAPTIFATGFTTIVDIDFGSDGSLYVLEHSTGPIFFAGLGDIVRVMPDSTRSVVVSNLTRPTSLIVDWDGTIYVTNNGIVPGVGEVLSIVP